VTRLQDEYPNDTVATVLGTEEAAENEPCPALDPATGACDLYAARPITCRTFGPALRTAHGDLAICELCYQEASAEEVASCQVEIDPQPESELLAEVERTTGVRGDTIVAFALAGTS
jgi:Fe-S-cluster containining protein